ncbi:MAG: ATP phosphoribosyltransferase [Phycisphaeraceae bacterium]
MLTDENKLRIALPGKGRLAEPAMELLKASGYSFRRSSRNLYASCRNADIVFIFLRADDIPVLVDSGVVDMGITGSDLVSEREANVAEVLELGFGRCRLCVAGPEGVDGAGLEYFAGKTIATSFPRTTRHFFAEQGVDVRTIEMNGSVEIMVGLRLADGIVDIVETGDSLRDNHLKVMAEIGTYQTVLIANPAVADAPGVAQVRRRIEGVIVAERYSVLEYNIPADLLARAEEITPGFESPTVSQLDEEGWLAVKVMVEKPRVVPVMDELEALGATAIFETHVRNCRL